MDKQFDIRLKQSWAALRIAFAAVPIIAGLDKYFDLLADWSAYVLDTKERVERSLRFLTSGYRENPEELLRGALFDVEYDEMVVVKDIELYALCEHHLLPYFGKVHVAYIPQGKVIGLSKVARVVDVYARRFQVQERLTTEIAKALEQAIRPLGVAVVIEARHFCMMMRGVQKQESSTVTSCMKGSFRNPETRTEFLSLIRKE
jgi:GTP cyclohydrolase I